jgi:cation-transporting P-type ATPase F
LPTNFGQGLIILAAVFAGVALPILPVQMLWVNLTTVLLLGLMLVFEPREPDLMQRPRVRRSPTAALTKPNGMEIPGKGIGVQNGSARTMSSIVHDRSICSGSNRKAAYRPPAASTTS